MEPLLYEDETTANTQEGHLEISYPNFSKHTRHTDSPIHQAATDSVSSSRRLSPSTYSVSVNTMWDDWNHWNHWNDDVPQPQEGPPPDSPLNFDFLSLLSKPKDYYGILEVDYDATEDAIRSNYIRLALKWHPDKQKDPDNATIRFQEINEAYQVLSDPVKRREYDKRKGLLHVYDYNMIEYLDRNKGLILTCNGLGIRHSIW